VIFSAACDSSGAYVASFSLPGASGRLDVNGDGVFGAGEVGLASGTYELTGGSYMWDAAPDAGRVFPAGTITAGSGATEPCVEVLGTTITTIPEVVAETLPFTGFDAGDTLKLGLLALLAGALMLFAVRDRDVAEAVSSNRSTGSWTPL